MAATVALPMRIGARTIAEVKRRLVRVPLSLADGIAGRTPGLPALPRDADGYFVTALPSQALKPLLHRYPALRPFVRQRYRRSFVSLGQGFEAYMAGFSSKSRSTLKRKRRKFADLAGGALDVRRCHAPGDVEEFHRHARAVSALTYQERLLDAGLPDGPEMVAGMRTLAERDALRAWLLFLDGRPVSYLYAPAEGETLIYAYLGYDPEFAHFSPGTVLQMEALRELMAEGRFALFDFTEGEGQHKRQFETGALECVDLLLLRRTPDNLAAGAALQLFDAGVASAKRAVRAFGLEKLARALRR